MDQLIEIDTHDTCLICMKICDDVDKLRTENLEKSSAFQGISDTTLKLFLRYLQIDVSKLTENTDSSSIRTGFGSLFSRRRQQDRVPPPMEVMETEVNVNTVGTCGRCSSVMNDFLALFQSLEKIRLRLAECVETVHDLIKEGDEERVREFRRRKMTAALTQSSRGDGEGGSRDVLKLNVERLRRETLEKCALRQKQSIPQIVVKRQPIDEDCNGGNSPSSSQASEDHDLVDEESTNELLLTDDEDDEEEEVTPSSAAVDIGHPLETISYGSNNHIKKFICGSCHKQFFREETLLRHTETYHPSIPNERGFLRQCQRVSRSVSKRSSSRRTSQKATSSKITVLNLTNGRFGCGQCGKQYPTRTLCVSHFLQHHNGESFHCSHCGKTIVHRKKFEAHLLLLHPLQTIGHKLPDNTNQHHLDQAVNAILNKKRWVSSSNTNTWGCPLCRRRYTPRMFKLHLLESHTEEIGKGVISLQQELGTTRQKKQAVCSHCSKSTSDMKHHLIMMHPVESLSSHLPPQTTEQDLNAAFKNVISGMNIGRRSRKVRRTCTICERSLITFRALKYHIFLRHLDRIVANLKTKSASTLTPANQQDDETTRKSSKENSSLCQIPVSLCKNILPPTSTAIKAKPSSLTRPLSLPQPTIIQQPQVNEPRLKSVLRSLSASSSTLLKSSNPSSLNQCPHCGNLFPFKSSLNAHLTSAHPFQLYFNRLPPGTNENDFDKAIDHLLDQPQADSFLSDQLGCRICASSPVPLIAAQTFPDRSYLKRHLLGRHLDKIIEQLSEAKNEIREVPLPLEMKIEESDMMGEVNVEENEDVTIHPEQDPLAI